MKHTGPLWGIWKIEESSEVLLSLLRNREEYLPQLELIRTEQRRREWLACRVLLQELTGGPVCVAYRPNGAPYLSGSSLHISISHTKGYAAVLFGGSSCRHRHRYRSGRCRGYTSRAKIRKRQKVSTKGEHETGTFVAPLVAKGLFSRWSGGKSISRHLHVRPFPMRRKGSFTVYETHYGRRKDGLSVGLSHYPDFVLTRS